MVRGMVFSTDDHVFYVIISYMYYAIMQFSLLLSRRQLPPTPPIDPSQIPQPVSKAICTDVVDGVGQYSPKMLSIFFLIH